MSGATNSNALGMSDEEFLNMPLEEATPVDSSEEATDVALESDESTTEEPESTETGDESTAEEESNDETTGESDSDEAEEESDEEASETETDSVEDSDSGDVDTGATEDGSEKAPETSNETDNEFKSFYEQVTSSFKANGRDMQVKDPQEVIQLMQMGANYAKKMAALKPSIKTMKVLEKNGLLEDGKLDFLIDLHNKNPEAIKKLLKDSKIDPLSIDIDEASDYKPKSHKIDDAELAMDEVLDSIKGTDTYNQTLDIVSNQWDDASRNIIATNPQLLQVINGHVSNGVYEKVWTEVERERTFGRLTGISDLEAYKSVGDKLFGQGEQASSPPQKKVVARKATKPDVNRTRKKQAASPSRSKPSSKSPDSFNPLSMSDDEFLKAANSKFV